MNTTTPRPGDIYRHGAACRLITAIDATHVYSRSWPNGRTQHRDSFQEWADLPRRKIGHEVRPDPATGRKGGVFIQDPVSTTEYKAALAALTGKRATHQGDKCATCEGTKAVGVRTGKPVRQLGVDASKWCPACGGSGKAPRGDVAVANALDADLDAVRREFQA